MEEIDFEQLKVLLEGQTDIEIISKIKKPIQVRIQDKHYRVTGIKKRDLLEYLTMFQIITNKKPHLCQAYRCSEKKAPKKRFCHKHHARFQKETNPIGYTYNALHQNAKRRGKEFKLTLEGVQNLL